MAEIKKAYVDSSIGQLHYRYVGEGDRLLMLHQTPSCSEVYEPIMQLLAPYFSIIAVDTPGFGMSPYPPHTYSIPEYAEIMLEFLDALSIEKTSLFGHHTGACTACELAASAPERVDKLIASKPILWFDNDSRRERLARVTPLVLTEDGGYLQETWEDFVGRQQGDAIDLDIKHREITWRLKAGPRYVDTIKAVFTHALQDRLPLIEAPTLVIAGEFERGVDGAKAAAELIPRARFQLVSGGRNWFEIEKYQEVAEIIRDFLTDQRV